MNGVLRLTYLHFAMGGWRRWWLFIGVIVVGASLVSPPTNSSGKYAPAIAFLGVVAIFFGGSLMPLVVNRLSQSHLSGILPFGRASLLGSAFLVTALVSLPLPLLISLMMLAISPEYAHVGLLHFMLTGIFLQLYAIVFWTCSAVYLLLYLFSTSRTMKKMVASLVVMFALMSLSPHLFLLGTNGINYFPLMLISASWTLFALYVLYWPIWRNSGSMIVTHLRKPLAWRRGVLPLNKNDQFALLLGLRGSQLDAVLLFAVVAIGMVSIRRVESLMFLVSGIGLGFGAVAGVTPGKSRSLWLRCCQSRDEVFAIIERVIWQTIGPGLVLLIACFVMTGLYQALPLPRIVIGSVQAAVAFAVTLYIGLLQTRGMHWGDAIAAIAMGSSIVAMSSYASSSSAIVSYVLLADAVLLVFGLAVRHWAKHRWRNIDWLLCKPIRVGQ